MNRNDANFQIGDLGLLEATPEMKAGLEKFDSGDPISDQELTQLMEFYTTLEASLRALGPRWDIVRIEAYRTCQRLHGFWEARQRRR